MMKKQLVLIIIFSVGIAACNLLGNSDKKVDVTFKTIQSSYVLGDTITAVLQNNSSHSITYGNPFQVEQKRHGKWEMINFRPSIGFTLQAYVLTPGKKTTYHFILSDSSQLFPPHSFSEGLYRITMNIGIEKQENSYTLKTPPFHLNDKAEQ